MKIKIVGAVIIAALLVGCTPEEQAFMTGAAVGGVAGSALTTYHNGYHYYDHGYGYGYGYSAYYPSGPRYCYDAYHNGCAAYR